MWRRKLVGAPMGIYAPASLRNRFQTVSLRTFLWSKFNRANDTDRWAKTSITVEVVCRQANSECGDRELQHRSHDGNSWTRQAFSTSEHCTREDADEMKKGRQLLLQINLKVSVRHRDDFSRLGSWPLTEFRSFYWKLYCPTFGVRSVASRSDCGGFKETEEVFCLRAMAIFAKSVYCKLL